MPQSELMFRLLRLFRVTVSIFPALTDRPINLIYRVSPHPLTSSTGLPSNNELPSSGTVDALCFLLCVPCRGLPQIIQAGCVRACERALQPERLRDQEASRGAASAAGAPLIGSLVD